MNIADPLRKLGLAVCFCSLGVALGGCSSGSRSVSLRGSVPMSQLTHQSSRPANQWQGRAGAPDSSDVVVAPPAPPADPRRLPMFHGETGEAITWASLVQMAAASDVVLLGETHGHALGLDCAATFFEDLVRASADAALSMEFLERDQQVAIDDYLSGVSDEAAFRTAAGRKDSNYPTGHQRMVEAAKAELRPVAAANAPRRYVRLARTEGFAHLASLSDAQRALFVVPRALSEGRYRDEFMKMMSGAPDHTTPPSPTPAPTPASPSDSESSAAPEEAPAEPAPEPEVDEKALGFFRSQNVWDATMAESIVRLVSAGARPVVHVVGQFHSDYDGGLTQRVREAMPSARVLTISFAAEDADGSLMRESDRGRAGVVIYVGERD